MQIRKEYKYLLHKDKLDQFRERLMPFVEIDKYARNKQGNEYKVRSIYFDTGRMDYFTEKDAGVKIRKKFRIRGYDDTKTNSTIFLEVKRKNNEIVWKNRAPVKFEDIQKLFITRDSDNLVIASDSFPKAVDDANVFLYYLYRQYLVPVILIVYDREPFYSKFNTDLRITFDKNIRSKVCSSLDGIFAEHKEVYALNDYLVLEIKFNFGFPLWLENIVKDFNLVRQAVSKYSICVENHKDEIEMLFRHPSIEFFSNNFSNKQIFDEVLATHDK